MTYLTAVKRLQAAPVGSNRRSPDRVSLLLRYLNVSLRSLAIVKILGESGKSACVTMLRHALTDGGYRTGALTTPFSHTATECIAVDGTPISMDDFADAFGRVWSAMLAIRADLEALPDYTEEEEPTDEPLRSLWAYRRQEIPFDPFSDELLLAAAMLYFTEQGCRAVLLEIPSDERSGAYRLPLAPLLSVVTALATPEVTARVCRRIERHSRETVSGLQNPTVTRAISDRCAAINCRLSFPLKNDFYVTELAANRMQFFYRGTEYVLNSGALYQAHNLLTVLEALSALKRQGFAVSPETASFQSLFTTAGVPLQFTFVSLNPTIVTDFADTPARLTAFAESLSYHKDVRRVTLLAEQSASADDALVEALAAYGITVTRAIRGETTTALRTVKPIAKTLCPEDTLLIVGSRPFVYESHRALIGLLP
ncbi:MAG: hypothetical protein IKV00_07790 [Clostridia bacterium]|nr:hypothetical protein [Clostridia bacterium]